MQTIPDKYWVILSKSDQMPNLIVDDEAWKEKY